MKHILPPLLCLLPTNRQSGGLWQWAYPQNEKKLLGQVNSPHKKAIYNHVYNIFRLF